MPEATGKRASEGPRGLAGSLQRVGVFPEVWSSGRTGRGGAKDASFRRADREWVDLGSVQSLIQQRSY